MPAVTRSLTFAHDPAWRWYALSIALMCAGGALAARAYPGGYDWGYTVISALASQKHNPGGGRWFAGGIALSMLCLWPVLDRLQLEVARNDRLGRRAIALLRVGVAAGILLGFERLIFTHFSDVVRKAHEALALLTLLGLYVGVIGLSVNRARQLSRFGWAAFAVTGPLAAIGASQLTLYLIQRDLGWVDRSWRELGVPLWLSFAFWQWLAAAGLCIALGLLLASTRKPCGKRRCPL